jgi:hypothetical protein
MSEGEQGKSLTTGFTTVAEIRRKNDVHELVYSDKKILIPTLCVVAAAVLGMIISFLA